MAKIPLSFYRQDDVVAISRQLIGKYLFTSIDGSVTGGMISETEAYRGPEDRASHAYLNRRTKRTETMFAEGGVAYVYLCYGIHYMFNIVTNVADIPHAILIRAIVPEVGIEMMRERRKNRLPLASSPGSLCQALGISLQHDGVLLDGDTIWLEDRQKSCQVAVSPRIGIDYAGEDRLKPWRFTLIS